MLKLFNGNNSDSESELQVNAGYANNYNNWRQKEEFHKLKTKYGVDAGDLGNSDDDGSSSDDEEEDEEGNELTEEFEKDFYKTLALLKNKDPRIYDEKVTFFEDTKGAEDEGEQEKKKRKIKEEKPLFLRDYERKVMTERGGKYSDDSDDEGKSEKHVDEEQASTYVQEQRKLKESFKKVLEEDEDEDDGLLAPKKKSDEEKIKEEEAYKEWLKGQSAKIDTEEVKELKPLRDFWTDPNLDNNEKFLRDYVLDKKFLDKDVPDYELKFDQVVHDSDENLSEDEKNIQKQEEFEHKYNFRFEEPDQDFIKRYPRTLENSLRKKDTRRAEKRVEVKKRKEEEKLRKREELKQLKALKRKEIEEKIEKLKEITGNDDMQFNDVDLDGDFDPEEHDRKMEKLFNENFYSGPEGDMKPVFPDIDEELGLESTWDKFDPEKEELVADDGPHCEDPDFNMDVEYDSSKALQSELAKSSGSKKRRRRSKLAAAIAKEKPKFDPVANSSYQSYLDQYYSLDYEDIIGDLPCRFKYRNVVSNDYGLTVEEILMADDKELNKWCSLKKALQYRPEHLELNDVRAYKQKSENEALKRKIFRSIYGPREETEEQQQNGDQQNNKRKRNKKKKKINATENKEKSDEKLAQKIPKEEDGSKKNENNENIVENDTKKLIKVEGEAKKTDEKNKAATKKETKNAKRNEKLEDNKNQKGKKKNRMNHNKVKKSDGKNDQIAHLSAERLKAYGINPKKFKNKLKYGQKR